MSTANNLNQLLTRVKSIFGNKTAPKASPTPNAEPPTDISIVSDPRLSAAFVDIEKYLAENCGTHAAKLRYKDYTNGASLDSEDTRFALKLVILTATDGAADLPDNVILLGSVDTNKGNDWLAEELCKFINYLKNRCKVHCIQHLALTFSKDKFDHPATVQTADVTCIRLY